MKFKAKKVVEAGIGILGQIMALKVIEQCANGNQPQVFGSSSEGQGELNVNLGQLGNLTIRSRYMNNIPHASNYRPQARSNQPSVSINGVHIPVGNGIHGRDLARAAGRGRRAVRIGCGSNSLLDPGRFYSREELMDASGRPVRITSIPDRTKGGVFPGMRDDYSRNIIIEQVMDMQEKFARNSELVLDQDNADWVIFPKFLMPPAWNVRTAGLLIVFPREYPSNPPIGFYLPEGLQSPNGHFFDQAYHGASNAPILEGWHWYCCTVNPGVWQPYPARHAGEWRYGDNLWTYITLINEILASPENAD